MRKTLLFLVVFLLPAFLLTASAAADDPSAVSPPQAELQKLIDARKGELQKIQEEMNAVKKTLEETTDDRKQLQSELRTIDKNIELMELGIRAGETEGRKLELETQALAADIREISASLELKLKALPEVLRAYHEKSEAEPLIVFLRNGSFADSFAEMQSLNSLQAQLAAGIEDYRKLKEELKNKQEEVSLKREEVELKKRDVSARQAIAVEEEKRKKTILVETQNKETLYRKNFEELAKKAMEFEAEIERVESALRKNIDLSKLPAPQPGLLQNPLPGARLTQGYGRTKFAVANYRSQWHNGVDLGAPLGTPVYAAEAGKIIATGNTDKYCPGQAYGKYVVIKHENNITTLYSHLSGYIVKNGEEVKRGELIGYTGKTGWATGPHVHFTVYASDTYETTQSRYCGSLPVGGDVNPLDYITI